MIIGNYKIKALDVLNITVSEKFEKSKDIIIGTDENGKEIKEKVLTGEFDYKVLNYHPNYEKALKWVINRELNNSEIETIEDILNKIEELNLMIERLV